MNVGKRTAIATIACGALTSILCAVIAQTTRPEILRISPTSGPEGSRVTITGENLEQASAVFLGSINTVSNDPRVPDEVSYKAGYVNPVPPPRDFKSAMLWGIAIADTRVPDHESAEVEIVSTQLSCRVDGRDVVLNDDRDSVRGGLYRRDPWFGTDEHDPMPLRHDVANHAVILGVGQRADRVWHFWSASPRAALPSGNLQGCTVKARVKISAGALLQMGMDYWRTPTVGYGPGGNNHEAGASNWYFPSDQWQEATFTNIGGPKLVRDGSQDHEQSWPW